MQQWYQCPRCGAPVAFGVGFCNNCGTQLNWPTQPQYQPPPQHPAQTPYYQQQYQQQYQEPQQPGDYQQQPEPPKKKSKIGIISLAIILVALAAVGSCVVCIMQPESSDITAPTPFTAAEQAYASAIVDQSTTLAGALAELGDLSQNYQFGDDEWTINVATQLAKIRLVYDEAMAMSPPSSMTEIHYKYTQGLKHYNTMTELFAQGIDELNASLIEQATTEMYIGKDYITEATNLINAFTESRSK
jgi:hypothetical protein